jgi:hypothetical protein
MRFKKSRFVGAVAALAMSTGFAATAAHAAKPVPAASCNNGDTTVTVKFDRSGSPLNNDSSVTVNGTSSEGTITADSSVLITSFVRNAGRTSDFVLLADPASEAGYDNIGVVNKRGKTLLLTSIDVCTTPNTSTPPPTAGFTLSFTCYPVTYADWNWEFAWTFVRDASKDTELLIQIRNLTTGYSFDRYELISKDIPPSENSNYEQANIGDHVQLDVFLDGQVLPDFHFDEVITASTTCAASHPTA